MRRIALLSLLPALTGALSAQSNTVAGLDGRLTVIDNLTYYGRRGPSFPNGEIGMIMPISPVVCTWCGPAMSSITTTSTLNVPVSCPGFSSR